MAGLQGVNGLAVNGPLGFLLQHTGAARSFLRPPAQFFCPPPCFATTSRRLYARDTATSSPAGSRPSRLQSPTSSAQPRRPLVLICLELPLLFCCRLAIFSRLMASVPTPLIQHSLLVRFWFRSGSGSGQSQLTIKQYVILYIMVVCSNLYNIIINNIAF